jgi:lipoprotein-anchoring transpeptidase ErfK/SrfK
MELRAPASAKRRISVPTRVWLGFFIALAATPAASAELTPAVVNSAEPSGKSLSAEKPSPLGVRLQVLLGRAHFSPGASDLTGELWKKLETDNAAVLTTYTITEKDVRGPFLHKLPQKMEAMKDIPRLSYTSPREGLAEKFHMSEQLLAALNPLQRFDRAGDTIIVVDTGDQNTANSTKAARVEVDKNRQTVKLFDRSNALIGFYPATVGSEEKPSPTGTLKVTAIEHNPTYRYDPKYHFKGIHSNKPFTIKPGPNNPVGTVWINLSAEGYGIHGTPDPGKVSKAQSHGCVRLTNWDAERVAKEVSKGTTVDFVDDMRS